VYRQQPPDRQVLGNWSMLDRGRHLGSFGSKSLLAETGGDATAWACAGVR